jgi:putative DNA methylase
MPARMPAIPCRRSQAGDPNGITYNLPEHGNAAFPGSLYAGKDAGDPMPAIPTAYIQLKNQVAMSPAKKLIEVALPLEAINQASQREKSIRHGHPSTLHLWWARRPLVAARAVIFAQMVDDPSAHPDLFPTAEAQEAERRRLFKIIEDLVLWENTTNEKVLQAARDEIRASWQRTCEANKDHPRAAELFNPDKLPAFHDPFAGGGALPLEAQRLGLEAWASDLNPVAVLINKAMIEIPPKFAGRPPVNPEARSEWKGVRNEYALQRDDCLAESNGGGPGTLPADPEAAAGGNLRHAFPDHPGHHLGPGQHRGGLDQGIGQGEGTVPGGSSGLAGRSGNAADPVRAVGMVSGIRDPQSPWPAGRGQPDADDAAPAVQEGLSGEERDTSGVPLTPHSSSLFPRQWRGAQGLAEDVRYYGEWMRKEAEKRIGHLYPKVEVTEEMAADRPDLKPLVRQKLTVIAWLWARTVRSPNPAFRHVDVPLASTFMLSTKAGKEAWVEVVRKDQSDPSDRAYAFTVRTRASHGPPPPEAKNGTSAGKRAAFKCVMSGTPITYDYIRAEGQAGRMGARLMAIVAEGERGRVYLPPTPEHEAIAREARPHDVPETELPPKALGFRVQEYGMTRWCDLFTPRQLVALTTFSDLVGEAMARVKRDALAAGLPDDNKPLRDGGAGATAYAQAVGVYLGIGISRQANRTATLNFWDQKGENVQQVFARQALPMTWDFVEGNPLSNSTGNFIGQVDYLARVVETTLPASSNGVVWQSDAQSQNLTGDKLVSTDPPYYDNIGYADLSDFFYVWLRRSLRSVFPELFATLATPKAEELVATPYRHGSREKAEAFFLEGMTRAMHRLAEQAHPAFPVTIYYAFKQQEVKEDKQEESNALDPESHSSLRSTHFSTGWETFLDAVIRAGFAITGTWPMRTEYTGNLKKNVAALASSIVLVCRPRPASAPTATRREFVSALKAELPAALAELQKANIAPVDLAQAAIGPGMAVYTRYAQVLDAQGRPVGVREALALTNQTLDEVLSEQEGDLDAETRWALTWFEQHGFDEGDFGDAETLSKAKNTSIEGLVEAGILASKRGKVRLLRPGELPADWDPATDARLTVWEMVHHLVRALSGGGEQAAAALLAELGGQADAARELCYRLYTICERKGRAGEALNYNALVQSWPEIARLAHERTRRQPMPDTLPLNS